MQLPIDPMAPILQAAIPLGNDWGYQLKWDGVRILAQINNGQVKLFSRNKLPKNDVYPELIQTLSRLKGDYVLDGEVIVFDPKLQRPVFQKVLQRERMKQKALIDKSGTSQPVQYVLFDMLQEGTVDLRKLPYKERHEKLTQHFPKKEETMFVTDLFEDGPALWRWVEANQWEGIVSKRLSSPYREGKKHQDWFKKKIVLHFSVDIVGFTWREGRLASLVMARDGLYFGRVSLGLNEPLKAKLLQRFQQITTKSDGQNPFPSLPHDLKYETVIWTSLDITCTVSGLEVTEAGLLRHPKIEVLSF